MDKHTAVPESLKKYYVAKCMNISSLKKCIESGQWACRDRVSPPHPNDILTEDFVAACKIIIIFSVNNCHGWHGYVELLDIPGSVPSKDDLDKKGEVHLKQNNLERNTSSFNSDMKNIEYASNSDGTCSTTVSECRTNCICNHGDTAECSNYGNTETCNHGNTANSQTNTWHHFPVKWLREYLSEFGEQCLPFHWTEELKFSDGSPVNKARNWQSLPESVGAKMCEYIDMYYDELCQKRMQKLKLKESKMEDPFFKAPDDQTLIEENWRKIHDKISNELGKVLLSCPFGSRRYNLHTPHSDMDMFIVYQADTRQLLSFDPPKQNVKSNDVNSCDYTIHEVFRFAELLLTGDPRCVETLFINDDAILQPSEAFCQLQEQRQLFLTRECLDKYLRDALGSRGLKQFKKWMDESSADSDVMPDKMCKLAYIIIRLLQNACHIVDGGPLVVYRPDDSDERKILMDLRNKKMSVQDTWTEINRLQKYVDERKDSVISDTGKLKSFLESWLISLRYKNFTMGEKT